MIRTSGAMALAISLLAAGLSWADGGYFVDISQTADLAQTRQEVLLAFHQTSDTDDTAQATYVLRSFYTGDAAAFAWVIPVPATPSDVVAHENDALFTDLSSATAPTFVVVDPSSGGSGWGCMCASLGQNDLNGTGGLVDIEASGTAGIFEWVALTSTGGTALLTWLNDNSYNVPTAAAAVLDQYVQADWHFLALRITEPASVATDTDGNIVIPPIQFTCQTERRVYPMVISQVSAASETEVIVYVLSDHRATGSNVANAEISRDDVAYDASSPSRTNYEALFRQALDAEAGPVLITESADTCYPSWMTWPNAPSAALSLSYLTRLRTVLTPAQMTVDFEFADAAADTDIDRYFTVEVPQTARAATVIAIPLAWTVVGGMACWFMKLGFRRRR